MGPGTKLHRAAVAAALGIGTVVASAGVADARSVAAGKPPVSASKPLTFTVTGPVSAVDLESSVVSVTVSVKGGNAKALEASEQTFSLDGVAVERDGLPAELAEVQVGDQASLRGVVTGSTWTVTKASFESPEPVVEEPPEPADGGGDVIVP